MASIKFTCDLSTKFDFEKITDNDYLSLNNIKKYTIDNYHILKYDKKALNASNYTTLGLFRSVIVKDGNIKCIAPFKSIPFDILNSYCENESATSNYTFHEYVEGTMVNVFHTGETWELATRSLMGGKGKFYKDSRQTFRTMFLDCMNASDLEFSDLNTEYCYSFVIQHPENRIVKRIKQPKLYLCGVYKPEGRKVHIIDYKNDGLLDGKVNYPLVYPQTTYQEAEAKYANKYTTAYDIQGFIIEYGPYRSKIRNISYEYVRKLRGNNTKPLYHYLTLRNTESVKEFLIYYPEYKKEFSEYRLQIHTFTQNLHTYYMNCFVQKMKPLKEFPFEYRPHMIELHKKYVDNRKIIDFKTVINYINTLEPARLMFAINYHHRK